ncbi:hypothetical protein CXB51_011857 [Gossypium anomalum]|uniref:DUF4283 domain-containing protein n=1 Tax=Gossypium anomalum TaxID=47600 RepID=A0A8J5Z559_9ROSI|nr:hypothetical protein CXB51_011857 [Gossypium anomalum]
MEKLSLIPDNVSPPLAVGDGDGSRSNSDRMTKKVRFKDGIGEEDAEMVEDSGSSPKISWKDKLLGTNSGGMDVGKLGPSSLDADEDLEFLEGDIHRSVVNGIPSIDFSERIQNILVKEMELTVILKLLGRNIGYGTLNNRISSLWNTAKPFHLMDIENGYILAKFQSFDDYTKVLALPGLPGYLYKKKIIEVIGNTIGKVVRLDFNTDSRSRGRFAM